MLTPFLSKLHIDYLVPILLCDNLNALMLSHNPILHARMKYIKLDTHFVRERVVVNHLQIQHVPAHAHIDGMLTKPLLTSMFTNFRNKLKVVMFKPP